MRRINHSSRFIEMFGNPVDSQEMGTLCVGDLCSVISGFPFKSELFNDNKVGKPLIRIRDVVRGYTETYTTEESDSQFIVKTGDLLVGMDGNFEISVWKSEEALLNQRVCMITPKDERITRNYIIYAVQPALTAIEEKTNATTVKHISASQISSIRLPRVEEVRVAEFDNVVHQADKSKFSDFKSRFIEECYSRYPKQKLGGHISVIRGVSYKPSDVRSSVDEEVAIILRSNNIADGEINFDDLVYVVQERVQNEQKLKPGDIVMCGSNGSISLVGKAGLLKDNMPNTAFGAFCLGIKCKETILPEYLNTYFNTQVYRNEIESMGNGTNIINIRPDNITNLFIPIPPVEKQMAFVEVVNQADKSKYLN